MCVHTRARVYVFACVSVVCLFCLVWFCDVVVVLLLVCVVVFLRRIVKLCLYKKCDTQQTRMLISKQDATEINLKTARNTNESQNDTQQNNNSEMGAVLLPTAK